MLKTILFFSLSFLLTMDRVAAVVGNKVILESSVNEQVEAFLLNSSTKINKDSLRVSVLNYLIEQEVLVYFAKQDSLLAVSSEEVGAIVGERLLFFEQQFGSVEALENYFGVPYIEIKNTLKNEAENMLLVDRFKQKLFSYVSISNTEVERFYDRKIDSLPLTPELYDYSCIEKKVAPNKLFLKETKKTADFVFNKIKSSEEPFESFYSKYSGGDLGDFRRGTFIPEFEVVAFSLKEGEVSPPTLSSLGYHIIRVNKRMGEKINASHILFPLSVSDSDRNIVRGSLDSLKKTTPSYLKIDSLSLSFKGGYGGVFNSAPKEYIPPLVLESIKTIEGSSGFSDVIKTDQDSFILVYLKKTHPPTTLDLYTYWGQVEWMALEEKFNHFYKDWYKQNKEKVYINIK